MRGLDHNSGQGADGIQGLGAQLVDFSAPLAVFPTLKHGIGRSYDQGRGLDRTNPNRSRQNLP